MTEVIEIPMGDPLIVDEEPAELAVLARRHLPEQGGIELQRDQAGKVHRWHEHSVHETLVVFAGTMSLEFIKAGESDGVNVLQAGEAKAGTRIELPARTVHQSTAGPDGCVYFIIPEGGRAAETTFVEESAFVS